MSKNVINIWNPKLITLTNAQQYFPGKYVNRKDRILFLSKKNLLAHALEGFHQKSARTSFREQWINTQAGQQLFESSFGNSAVEK